MYIKNVQLKNYRNYKEASIDFGEHINIIYGDNAQGKTNLIEAIYLCATSKSHRHNFDKELIKIGEKEAHIFIDFMKNDISEKIDMHLKSRGKKGIAINKLPIKKLRELFGFMHVIMFSPEDLGLIKNGPKDRRRFIDIELSQLNPLYMYYLGQYHKVLKQRNGLLKSHQAKEDLEALIEVFDLQLIEYGTKLIKYRSEFIDELNPIFSKKHYQLSGEKEHIELIYEQNTPVEYYENKLIKMRQADIKKGTTSVGPHRDDIKFDINGIDIRKYGSQGQQRTAALALKLSEIELVKKQIEDTPILLLDDVLSELDVNRQTYLIEHLEEVQTFITCTGIEDFVKKQLKGCALYEVKEAIITKTS